MAIIKCKMCGGDLALAEGSTIATCEYCGSTQTVPSADNEKKLTLFSRANRLRAACEFDKAAGVFEAIVADFPEEAESYWGLVLCKYGIEYVDDPATGKKIPTCHRTSFDSVMEDGNLEQALENADQAARKLYREEAKRIEELRKGIIEVSATEDPYDIFICYKETDANGSRTLDSVLAQDIYDALTEKGYRVFFSRISLEDKLGREYEPYIFAALTSAKVMLAIGTDYEHYNAVWVKNEWSRFLKLMEKDKEKHLIPCFKGIDAYDMPQEFSKLQAQDLGKVGAIQDLLRGIGKIIDTGTVTVTQTAGTTTVIVDTMLKRAADAIAARDWEKADRCCNNVLDYDDGNEQAYISKLLINFRQTSLTDLEKGGKSIAKDPNYLYLTQKGSQSVSRQMRNLESTIQENIRRAKAQEAKLKKQRSRRKLKITLSILAAVLVIALGAFLVQNVVIPGITYGKAKTMVKNGQYEQAVQTFRSLGDFRDSSAQIHETWLQKAADFAAQGEYAIALQVLEENGLPEMDYGDSRQRKLEYTYLQAKEFHEAGDYHNAIAGFEQLPGYEDADECLADCRYALAEISYENGDYDTAIDQFRALGDDGTQRALEIGYEIAQLCYENAEYDRAIAYFEALGDYQQGAQRALEITYEVAQSCYQSGSYDDAISYFTAAGDYENSADMVRKVTYEAGTRAMQDKQYKKAIGYFERIDDYSDALNQMHRAMYQYCSDKKDNPDKDAQDYIRELKQIQYSGAEYLYRQIFAWKAEISMQVSFRMGSNTGVDIKAKLSGGDGSSTKVRFTVQVSGQTLNYCDDKQYSAGSEPSCTISNPVQDITKLTYVVTVYDENGNSIGTFRGVPYDSFA